MRSMFSPALTCAVAVLALFSPAAATTTSCRSDSDCPAYTGTIPNNVLFCDTSIGMCLPRICNSQQNPPPPADKCSEYASQTYCSAATNSCRLAIGAFQACSALDFNPCVPGLLCRPPETSDSPWTCQSKPSPASAFPPRSTTTAWAWQTLDTNSMWDPPTTNSPPSTDIIPQVVVFILLLAVALSLCSFCLKKKSTGTMPRDPDVVVESIDAPPAYSTAPRGGEVVAASTPIRSPLATGAGDIPLAVLPSAPPAPTSMAPPELAPSNSR